MPGTVGVLGGSVFITGMEALMASSKQKVFKYFGVNQRPTNVCWNGTSFPINSGDVIKCFPEFIAAFINEKCYRELRPDEIEKATIKFTFGTSPFFLKPDPMGGLPMRSVEGTGPKLKDKMPKRFSPATAEDEKPVNPYAEATEGGATAALPNPAVQEEPKLVISTAQDTPSAPEPDATGMEISTQIDIGGGEMVGSEVTPEDKPAGPVADNPVTEEVVEEVVEVVEEPTPPGKTELRQLLADPTRALAFAVRDAGCPSKPEMLDAFNEFDDDTARGVVFAALWEYYGYDN
jgi:hypothetical protein